MITKKISIIGAGAVGSTTAFSILTRFDVKELVLIDIIEGLAKGIALDLEDTRGFLGFSTQIEGSTDFSSIKNSDVIVFTAGVTRKEGMSRLDLLNINRKIARNVSAEIKEHAPGAIVVVVTNPLDIITYIVLKETGFRRFSVFGMGSSLDTSRLMSQLYKNTKAKITTFKGFIFGPHANEMIISTERIKAEGKCIDKLLENKDLEKLKNSAKTRGAEIVGFLKNRSASFAPALATCRIIEAIIKDEDEVIPVSVLLDGEYGAKDICMGVPCVINKDGIKKIVELNLTNEEKSQINNFAKSFNESALK